MEAAARSKPYFSNFTTKFFTFHKETGFTNHKASTGKFGALHARSPNKYVPSPPGTRLSWHTNYASSNGALITSSFIPENAKKKNMRPKFELYNTSDKDAALLRHTKRLAHISIPVKKDMADDVRIGRAIDEDLHALQHTPLLHQQWDPERVVESPFDSRDSAGRPLPAAPLEDFPRFFNREMFQELDSWQAKTNETRLNPNNEMFIYYHFWAHDDKWVHRRRNDVHDFVKTQAAEYLREKLRSVQILLHGEERAYGSVGGDDGPAIILRHHGVQVQEVAGGLAAVELFVNCKPADPLAKPLAGASLRYKVKSEGAWHTALLTDEGTALITFTVPRAILAGDAVLVEVEGAQLNLSLAQKEDGAARASSAVRPKLSPPSDLTRALPGWTAQEVEALYRQELLRFEEELYNTYRNIDAITHPSPVMYASQNELMQMGQKHRYNLLQSKKNYDWWFHHQSFSLYVNPPPPPNSTQTPHTSTPRNTTTTTTTTRYLPFHDEEFLHRLQSWRTNVNQVLGNSSHIDQLRQYSPQPVNCLMQVFRKHNNVWDSRVFKVQHDVEGEYQEEATQEWSFVEDQREPQPTPPAHLSPARQPRPVEGVEPEMLDPLEVRDSVWAQIRTPTDKITVEGAAQSYAEEYWQDSLAARKAHNEPLHPDDQPGLEVEPQPQFSAAPEADRYALSYFVVCWEISILFYTIAHRKKYVRRLGKMYRKYVNPYHPNPQRFVSGQFRTEEKVAEQFYW